VALRLRPGACDRSGDACVVEADKIQEFGRVEAIVGEEESSDKSIPVVLRRATLQDQSRASENVLFTKSASRRCQEKIKSLQLQMKLIRVRYSFDRAKLLVIFTAEERVDFRQLVHDLAAETHARVEMRQIGARGCGRHPRRNGALRPGDLLRVWLKEFDNINIRMAKQQGLSLNPAALTACGGRLKCCLR